MAIILFSILFFFWWGRGIGKVQFFYFIFVSPVKSDYINDCLTRLRTGLIIDEDSYLISDLKGVILSSCPNT